VTQGFGLSEVSLEYSRPSAKGRAIFGDLVPYGKIWRTGANNASKLTFGEDVKIAGQDLKAGTYAVYSIPGEKEWQIMFYTDLKLGGYVSNYDVANEALKVTLPIEKTGSKTETFTIGFSNIADTAMDIYMKWENTKITIPVTVEIDAKVMAGIDAAMKDSRPYFQAAMYYMNNGKDLSKALEWITIAADNNPNAYWVLLNKAKIQHALGDHKAAVATATEARAKAEAGQNDDYVKMSDEVIAKCMDEMKKPMPAKTK
jgi:tetratricopeptide (TPR) repeat protein